MLYSIKVRTNDRREFVDISREIEELVEKTKINEGLCCIYIPHTTAGITINENADPDVVGDIIKTLDKLVPFENGYRHSEGNSDAHIKAGMMGFAQNVIISGGRLLLGTWQGIYLCEFDGPRDRKIYIKIMEG